MFGSKFKIWMENHIVRPKRKNQQEKERANYNGVKGVILESSESLAQSDTGISSESQQVLSSSNTDNNEGYCTTTMESSRSGLAHCHTAINLSSPESAYSTGYSTDGTSPGATGPPEYYINIRTGKHYFPSPAPTPTSPQPSTAFSQLHQAANHCITTSFLSNDTRPSSIPSCTSQLSSLLSGNEASASTPSACLASSYAYNGFSQTLTPFVPAKRNDLSSSVPSHFLKSPRKAPPKSPLSTLKLFLKSPKQDKLKPKADEKAATFQNKKSPVKNKKWYKQPFQKFGHRRTDSTDETVLKSESVRRETHLDRNLYLLTKDNTASPRQRNRIRTNPWLPTEPMSTQNFYNLQVNFSSSLVRNRSCTNTPLQNRKTETDEVEKKMKSLSVKYENPKESLERAMNLHIGQKVVLEVSDHSEEDVTLNEMMGTYNESYIYEKETDILSDSDPTDCEDYVSDSEADNGGDEQDSHDDELDFIDTSSIIEGDSILKNTGKCTYYDIYAKKNSFLSRNNRHHSRSVSESKKSFKKDGETMRKRSKEDKRKKSIRKSLRNPEQKMVERPTERMKVEPVNMSKLIMQRANGNNGSKSADGTPVCLRRRKLRESHIGDQRAGNVENGSSLINAVLEDDLEADKKYKELIREAETIFVTMQSSPIIQARREVITANKEKESLKIWQEAESMCEAKVVTGMPRKQGSNSRRNLGLSLAVDSKKSGKSSLKAKSSAHSPLDPLGPTFRNFTIFKEVEKKISSSSEDSESSKPFAASRGNVVPIAFQSVDLGKPITPYCPQSEPVKRKIYSCSKTYDKLVKRFENEGKVVHEGGTRNSSLRKRSDSYKSMPYHEREPIPDVPPGPAIREGQVGNFFYNPVYSRSSTPLTKRKPCNRNRVSSPSVCRRLSHELDAIR